MIPRPLAKRYCVGDPMLSYRHGFHAGNFADVLKHIVLVELLEYMTLKDKPFEYIDTHAGAGMYRLDTPQAGKTAEFQDGIARLSAEGFPQLQKYLSLVSRANGGNNLNCYPGSPWLAQQYLRGKDRAWLYEAHPADFAALQQLMAADRHVRCDSGDGFNGLLAHLPPTAKRGLVLMDPPYEIKSDYQKVVEFLGKAHRKFANGVYALWYPVVERSRIETLERQLSNSGIRSIQLFELAVLADSPERGMTGSGMIVINPPWTLFPWMQQLLPELLNTLGEPGGFYRCEQLVAE